jgi:hypothetical protein
MIDLLGEQQLCFQSGGYVVCNFVVRNGKIVRSKKGKWLRFPAYLKKKAIKDKVDLINEKTPNTLREREF